MTVLDLSSNDLATLDPACFKANGVTGVILGVYSPSDAPNTMRKAAQACRDAGLDILGFYGLIYFGDAYGETRDTQWAIPLVQEFGGRVWLDCETDANANGWHSPTPTPEQRVAAIHRAVNLATGPGLSVGIYTGGWWWPSATGNSTDFADLPLWHSQYADNAGTYSEVREVNYGGWRKVAIHQWTSTRVLCGRVRDHNTVFEEDEVTRQELEDLWLAIASGQEEATLDRATRVANAQYRVGQIVAGERPSMLELAYATKGKVDAFSQRTVPGLAADQ